MKTLITILLIIFSIWCFVKYAASQSHRGPGEPWDDINNLRP